MIYQRTRPHIVNEHGHARNPAHDCTGRRAKKTRWRNSIAELRAREADFLIGIPKMSIESLGYQLKS